MKNSSLYITLFLLLPVLALAQRKAVTGRVVADDLPQMGILVVNLDAEREARTDSKGLFTLMVQAGDSLIITEISIKPASVVVTQAFFTSIQDIAVELNDSYMLDEVVVEEDYSLTAEGLGIVPAGQKQYTSMERKLYTAGDFKPVHLIGLIAGGLAVDPILNAINGRTKMIKQAVTVEGKMVLLNTLYGMFTIEEVTDKFKIPKEYVPAFYYYCVEDPEFAAAMKQKNETLATFLITGLARHYLEILIPADAEPDGQ